MTCIPFTDGNGFVCMPTVTERRVRILYCPKCKQKRRVEMRFEEWYGWSGECKAKRKWRNGHIVECGQRWDGG